MTNDAAEVTVCVRRTSPPYATYVAGAVLAIVAGVVLGVIVTRDRGDAATPSAKSTKPAGAHVRFESVPTGATVTLVEAGQPTVVGTTPVEATIDPARHYEVVMAREGYTTRVQPVDPKVARVMIPLDQAP
jgi:hypothetical protein